MRFPKCALVLLSGSLFAGLLPSAAWAGSMAQSDVEQPATYAAASSEIGLGKGQFVFAGWDGPDIPVFTYIPQGIDISTAPIAFIMHGASRNPDSYRDAWMEEADTQGFIVIAPGFSREDFPGSRDYNLGGVVGADGQPRPRSRWTFSVIEPLFDHVVAELRGSQTHYTIYGHSAGSQFVHRFLFFMPDTRAKRFLAANAGWYTFPDRSVAFPFGLDGTPASEARLRAALAKDVVVLLGDQDTETDHRMLNRSKEAMQQGRHRFERGQNFFETAQKLAQENGWEFGWRLRVVEGVAHSNSGMAAGSYDLIE